MKRWKRSSCTSAGTGSGSSLALATLDRAVFEAADLIQLRLVDEVQQHLELFLGLAGEADDEGGAQG